MCGRDSQAKAGKVKGERPGQAHYSECLVEKSSEDNEADLNEKLLVSKTWIIQAKISHCYVHGHTTCV